MEDEKEKVSEAVEGESEDLPSDFFDDFSKADFMEGLSVVDEFWEDNSGPAPRRSSRSRINTKDLDSVKDLRDLLVRDKPEDGDRDRKIHSPDKYKWHKPESPKTSEIDNFTKPGSRRDPSKTNEAIKKDKEVKVQQFLAKTLESTDDLRPPGTELDDYYDENKKGAKRELEHTEEDAHSQEKFREGDVKRERVESPQRARRSSPSRPRHSPRPQRRSPRARSPQVRGNPYEGPRFGFRRFSPPHFKRGFPGRRFSPGRRNVRNFSPQRRSPTRQTRSPMRQTRSPMRQTRSPMRQTRSPMRQTRSPMRQTRSPMRQTRSPMRQSRRYSPRRSPRRQHRSRSPRDRRSPRRRSRSRSRSRSRHGDNFLYPNNSNTPHYPPYHQELQHQYVPPEYSGVPGYAYPQAAYGSGYPAPYNYGGPPVPQAPLPAPVMASAAPIPAPVINPGPPSAPLMVPAPTGPAADKATPYDALAQLLADGKISQEDYLKLTPNKGASTSAMDTKTRVMVLTRCNQALSKLDQLLLPNRLILNNQMIGADDKYIKPKYCSPLKRQAAVEFSFTKGSLSSAQQTKHLVESIISTLGLDKVVSKYKKNLPKNMKDAEMQTSKTPCEVCEIRESTKYHDVGTSIDPEYFSTAVYTQVVEEDLVSSKSVFNPSGSMGDGGPISIAHLTPAQLVSQLAARAKTLKQPQDDVQGQYNRRPPQNYEFDGRGGQQYHPSYNNYRY